MSKHTTSRNRPTAKHSCAVSLLVIGAEAIIGILIFLMSTPTPH